MPAVFCAARQKCGGEAIGANLQRKKAVPAGHETGGNERPERVRHYEEACEPPALA
jgi:hypothetical protein